MNYKIQISKLIDELSEYLAQLMIDKVNSSEKKINIALSGGSTPKHIFKYLARNYNSKINWNKINFFWGDERCVPPDDPESNYRMTYENLLSKISVPKENIFRIKGENNSTDEAKRYSEIILKELPQKNNLPQFDLIMLGLGEDGHTASIFPNQKNLLNSDKIYSTAVHPTSGQTRITLTGRVINNASTVVFIATGNNKAKVVNEIINQKDTSKDYPASFIKPHDGELYWLLDKSAASEISEVKK